MDTENFEELSNLSEMVMSLIGISNLAYIRPVQKGAETEYGIYAADGTQLGTFPTHAAAYYTARQHNLEPSSLH